MAIGLTRVDAPPNVAQVRGIVARTQFMHEGGAVEGDVPQPEGVATPQAGLAPRLRLDVEAVARTRL
jgi:hypothetical protein